MKKSILFASIMLMGLLIWTGCGTTEQPQEPDAEVSEETVPEEAPSETPSETPSEEENEEILTEIVTGMTPFDPNVPVMINGEQFTLLVSEPGAEDEELCVVTAQYGTETQTLDNISLEVLYAYGIVMEDKAYVLTETVTYSDWHTMYLIALENGQMSVSEIEGSAVPVSNDPNDGFRVTSRIYVLGTRGGTRLFHLKDGTMEPEGETYLFDRDAETPLLVKADLACRVEGANAVLHAGDQIIPVSYSEDGTFAFELEDGTAGSLQVDLDENGFYTGMIGGVIEMELLENVPYAS